MWWLKKRTPIVSRWWLILLLMGAVVMMFSAVMRGQTVHATKVEDLGRFAGKTQCDAQGNIEILISMKVPPSELAETMTHEAVHVLQIRSYGTCLSFFEHFIHDRQFALFQEAEAYCVEYRMFAENANQLLALTDRVASFFWETKMRGKFDSYPALKAFVVNVCSKDGPNVPVVRFISAVGAVAIFEISHKETTNVPP